MKFKNYIETESGIKDTSTSPGTAGQVLSSTVTGTSWIDQDEIIAAASKLVVIACKNVSGVPILKGTPVYQSGTVGATDVIEIEPADATISTGYLPAIGILQTTLNNNIFGNVVITGEFLNYDTASIPTNNPGGVPITGDTVYLAAGGGLTCIKPTGEGNAIQNLGLIGKVSGGTAGSITVSSIMRANDVPNLPTGKIWVGDGNTIVSDTVYLDEVNNELGINTINPLAKLQVNTGSDINAQLGLDSFGSFKLGDVSGNYAGRGIFYDSSTPGSENMEIRSDIFRISGAGGEGIQQVSNGDIYLNASQGILATLDASTNNFGIGTTTPALKLEVEGGDGLLQLSTTSSTGSPYMSFNQAGARRSFIQHNDSGDTLKIVSEYGGIDFYTGTIGVETERMTIQSGGNVGIGTTNPTGKLEVSQIANNGNTGAFTNTHVKLKAAAIADNTGFVGITAATSLSDNYGYSFGAQRTSGGVGNFKINYHNNSAAGVNRFIIDINGQVGIGTTSLSKNLTIGQISDSATDAGIFSNNQSRFYLTTATNTTASCGLHFGDSQFAEVNTRGKIEYNANVSPASNYFQFRVNFSDAMRLGLNSSGAVRAGIGTTSPSSMLQVNGGVQLANDTDTASASKVGTFRYYTSGNNSYVDMCMQTGAATYAWVNIVTNSW